MLAQEVNPFVIPEVFKMWGEIFHDQYEQAKKNSESRKEAFDETTERIREIRNSMKRK